VHVPRQLYIDGSWRDAADGSTFPVVDPATEEVVAEVPSATPQDVDDAVDAAERAFAGWRTTDVWTRSAHLRKVATWLREHTDELAAVATEEQGKPLAQAAGELAATADQFDWYADEARRIYGRLVDGHATDHRLLVRREPIGPVAAFAPGNFPFLLPARKLAAALAAGCTVVLKPAEATPRCAFLLGAACEAAGLPRGTVNILTGDPVAISERLVAAPAIRKVSLTGSVPVGRQIAMQAAERLVPVSLELGGHSPVLVLDDVAAEDVGRTAAEGKFRNAGQVCIAASRFLVLESVAERFVDAFVDRTRALEVGDGRTPGVEMGPLEAPARIHTTESLLEDALAGGAELVCGGGRPDGYDRGYFFEPTVLTGVTDAMAVMRTEPFGPIAPITTCASWEEAVDIANAVPYGLAGFVFTRDLRAAFEVSEALEVGMVGVNHLTVATAEAPFGGVKSSGMGREGGSEGIDAYTVTKYINMKL
jgi:succinate-semialdehyde dehydrogenase / glutarate-semialdehyde dehydrogenase